PTMGGVLVIFAVLVAVGVLADFTVFYVWAGLFTMAYLATLGFVDDWLKLNDKRAGGSRDGLKLYQKLVFQVSLGVMLGFFLYWRSPDKVLALPFVKEPLLLSVPVFMFMTVVVVAGTSNAVNLTDGMDGLASGCVALCCLVFMVLAWAVGDARTAGYLLMPHVPEAGELAVFCGAMMGACLGFLWYNCHPAQVFMGDTGSLPLGGLLGYVAICIRQELMLLIVGGVFVIEALSVMLQVGYFKWSGGKRIFLVAPIHHHYQLKGWTETQVVTRFWLLAALFAAIALATTKLR
ncbi:MAG: phospho-N-acetylmuramoyl-pentapeptide-transferase, partial [Planctomycetota bacterium]|nr:phospho-N-acetylmuramoyl-pentapeptide-transferase [Planctomycetota bacterium]